MRGNIRVLYFYIHIKKSCSNTATKAAIWALGRKLFQKPNPAGPWTGTSRLESHKLLSLLKKLFIFHKTVLYISVSFAVSYTGLLLPSF